MLFKDKNIKWIWLLLRSEPQRNLKRHSLYFGPQELLKNLSQERKFNIFIYFYLSFNSFYPALFCLILLICEKWFFPNFFTPSLNFTGTLQAYKLYSQIVYLFPNIILPILETLTRRMVVLGLVGNWPGQYQECIWFTTYVYSIAKCLHMEITL